MRIGDATPATPMVIPGVFPPPGSPGYVPLPEVVPNNPISPTPTPGGTPSAGDQAAMTAIATAYGQMSPAGQDAVFTFVSQNGDGKAMFTSAELKMAALGAGAGLLLGWALSKVLR